MKLKPVIVFVALAATLPSFSQEKALEAISRERAEEYLEYLASDSLGGRRTGSEGNKAAAAFISETALKTGIKPLPGQDDLFQPLEYLRITPIPGESNVTLTDSTGNVLYTSNVIPLVPPSDTVSISGEVVFAGYGYSDSKENYNDFDNISLKNRIVIIMTRNPDLKGSGMPSSESSISEMMEVRKLPSIMLQNANAVFFVADPALGTDISADLLSMGSSYNLVPLFRKQMFFFNINAYAITHEAVDRMLRNAGVTLKDLQDSIATSREPVSFVIPDLRADVQVNVVKDTVTSSNIIGIIEGSDPVLKKEAVLYSAHYDHVGIDAAGNIYNGANDNASGSVGLLNVAAAFSALEQKPPRSIIFFWTTGEEEGLHGSSYYAENPLFPLENTIADINFDMIGRSRRETDTGASLTGEYDITGKDTIKVISGADCHKLIAFAEEACKESGIYMIDEGKGTHFSGSDHYPFYRKGIPVLFFFTGLHKDYHKPSDDYELIDFDKLLKVSKAGFLTGYMLATDPVRPELEKKSQK
jgi:hypothetical protein